MGRKKKEKGYTQYLDLEGLERQPGDDEEREKPEFGPWYSKLEKKRSEEKQPVTWQNRWRLWHLTVAERFYFALKDNRVHPFTELGKGFYQITLRNDRRGFGLFLVLGALSCFISFSVFLGVFSFTVITFIFTFGFGMIFLEGNLTTKELIISRTGGYMVRVQTTRKVIFEELISNLYIKLMKRWDSNQNAHFYLIIGGYRLDDIRLTGFDYNVRPLRVLARALAKRMGINYFDIRGSSSLHRIFHYPAGLNVMHPKERDFKFFLKSHNITNDMVEKARKAEGLPKGTSTVPQAILSKVLIDYGRSPNERFVRGIAPQRKENYSKRILRLHSFQRRLSPSQSGPTLTKMLDIEQSKVFSGIRNAYISRHRFDMNIPEHLRKPASRVTKPRENQ